MAIRDKSRGGTPGQELKHFTDRHNELASFQRLLDINEPVQLPALMFFGVGGTGKSWLLGRFRNWLIERSGPPSAYVDFDRRSGGPSFVSDFSFLLAEIWQQLDVECPRFETAYAWMRFKQSAGDRPLVRHSGKVSTGWDLVKEVSNAGFGWVPGFNLVVWAAHKLGKLALKQFEKTRLGEHLLTQAGQEDFVRLSRMTAQEIYPRLTERLGQDLDEQLPKCDEKRCRAVVFLDTFEDLAGSEKNEARRQVAEEPVRELYSRLTCVLLVLFGRDRLTWDEIDPEWSDEANLQQIPLGGLSRHDATDFLGKCDIKPGPLLEAILRVSRDETLRDQEAYFPFNLGLCADTVVAERGRGSEPKPDTFDMSPGDYNKLAQRFLKSLHDEHPEQWIIQLAQTPRFDEVAARSAFSQTRDVLQTNAWESLPDYSFVQEDAMRSWFRIHSVMRDVLCRRWAGDPEEFAKAHTDWQTHWQSRSQHETDEFAALAWYHYHVRDPRQALSIWNEKAERVRLARQMSKHLDLLDWWTPTAIEERVSGTREEATELVSLGNELRYATLGDLSTNLRRAIACYEAALQVWTVVDAPEDWAITQKNLGLTYSVLPTGSPDKNLRRAIAFYEAALQVYTEADFPEGWAATQNNLGNAYRDLSTGNPDKNLRRAIAFYEAALRVLTEAEFPKYWATTQNNLGRAYSDLQTNRGENIARAIVCYTAALRVRTEADFPEGWAATQNSLGVAYWEIPTGDRGENLHCAIACFESALRVRTEANFPVSWAMTQINLGNAFCDLLSEDRDKNLRRAVTYYRAALRVFTQAAFPTHWAMTQQNLGTAYADLRTPDYDENLRLAIACYEAALRVYTEPDFPSNWAMAQHNLGAAYADLRTPDYDENLHLAIACFDAALRVRSESDFPSDLAMTQHNLGTVYCILSTGNPAENLRRAIACYESALRVRTETDFPLKWAETQLALGLALKEQHRYEESLQAFKSAVRGFESVGEHTQADRARGMIEA